MKFMKWSLAIATLMLVAPLSASALGISIVGVSSTATTGSTTVIDGGDVITFDLVLENGTAEEILGLGIGVFGYEDGSVGDSFDDRLTFAGGLNAPSVFNEAIVPTVGAVGGLEALRGVVEEGAAFPISDPRRVSLFVGAQVGSGSTGDGSNDFGIAGLQTNGADVHFQVSFAANPQLTAGDVTLTFGTGEHGNAAVTQGGALLSFNNAQYTLTVVPEPGTALLMGLGLAGLAARRR